MDSISEFCGYLRYEAGRSPLTIEAYERDLREFATFIEGDGHPYTFNPESVTLSDVRSWVAYLGDPTGAGDAAATLRRKVQSLRAFFRFLMKRHRRLDNPAAQLTLPRLARHLPDFIKAAEMEKILSDDDPATNPEALPEEIRNHLIIDILYSTGMRQAELLSLTDDDIFASHGELRVTGKRGKTRILPLPLPLHRRILRWQSVRDSIYHDLPEPRPLIATRHGSMSKSTLYSIVKRMLAPAATGRKSPHTLRHTFATAMLNGGGQLTDVKELLGHESLSTTQIYTHVSFAEIRSAYSHSHPRAGAASTPSHTTKKETSEKNNREE